MASTSLRLVKDQPDTRYTAGGSLRFEQRRAVRHSVIGRVTAVSTIRGSDGTRNRICSLVLRDMSETGVGVLSQEALDPDTTLTMYFPPHGADRGFDAVGKVVRCRRTDQGHDVGIVLVHPAAA